MNVLVSFLQKNSSIFSNTYLALVDLSCPYVDNTLNRPTTNKYLQLVVLATRLTSLLTPQYESSHPT